MIFLCLLLVFSSIGAVDILGWAKGYFTTCQPAIAREKLPESSTVQQTTTIFSSGIHKHIEQENTNCMDLDKNCTQYVSTFCKDERYMGLMSSRCAATCGLCCVDKDQNCKHWKVHGFCESEFYQAKKSLCQVTCGLCDISLNRRLTV